MSPTKILAAEVPPIEEPFDPDREVVDFVQTVTEFAKGDDAGLIREFLRKHKTTGQFIIHLNQGGTTRQELIEKSPIDRFDFNERSVGDDPSEE